MFIIESKYGNDGYAVWFKLIEQLGLANDHYLDLRDDTQLIYLSSLFKVDENTFKNILNDLAKIDAINNELYTDHSIIFSEKFVDSIIDAYKRRNNKCVDLYSLCLQLGIKCIHKPSKCIPNVDNNPQSKVKDTILKDTILKESKEKDNVLMLNFPLPDYNSKSDRSTCINYTAKKLHIALANEFPNNYDVANASVLDWKIPVKELIVKRKYTPDQVFTIANFAMDHDFWKKIVLDSKSLTKNFEKIKEQYHAEADKKSN